ncbi:MAG: DUF695 domain-containing protein [Rubrivivax sp.]|nr:MAG: DUF695 domain-containing protein [Rubrivivax sp.]
MARRSSSAMTRTDDMAWTLACGETADYVIFLRYCQLPADFPRARFPVRLNVFWQVADPTPEGQPKSADGDDMAAFEERIVAATEPAGVAVLPLVLTGRGEREYVFYARSADDFLQCLTDMPQEVEPYPVEIYSCDDPDWHYYEAEVAAVQPASST